MGLQVVFDPWSCSLMHTECRRPPNIRLRRTSKHINASVRWTSRRTTGKCWLSIAATGCAEKLRDQSQRNESNGVNSSGLLYLQMLPSVRAVPKACSNHPGPRTRRTSEKYMGLRPLSARVGGPCPATRHGPDPNKPLRDALLSKHPSLNTNV